MWCRAGLPFFAAVLFLSACGPTQPQTPPVGGEARQVKPGGALKLRMDRDPWDWDATISGISTSNEYGMSLAYSQLLGFKVGEGIRYNDLILEPELA